MDKFLVIDSRLNSESKDALINLGYKLIEIPEISCLEQPICGHPDMSLLKFKELPFFFGDINISFTISSFKKLIREHDNGEILKYPHNVKLNCAVVGNNIICNRKYTDPQVIGYAEKHGYNIIHVNQGYAKCSTCIVSDNAVITEDESIEKECTKHGIDVLKISKGYVRLDGYDYGFIGGCSGLVENNLLVFNGNIKLHPDYDSIYKFCKDHGTDILSLNNGQLYDVGSIIRL